MGEKIFTKVFVSGIKIEIEIEIEVKTGTIIEPIEAARSFSHRL